MAFDNACIAGLDGYFRRVNPSWTRTLGWTAEELMSKPSIEFVHPDDRAATLAGRQRLGEGREMGPLVNRYLCKDGSYRWFEWRSVGVPSRGLVFASARDITEQKLTEQRLHEANLERKKLESQLIFAGRMASVGTLAAGVAHEINNPLAVVSGNLGVLLEDLESVDGLASADQLREFEELLTDAQAAAERIRKIVRGMQTFSRTEDERRTVLAVQPLLELSINLSFNEIRHRARLVRDFGPIPRVEADEGRLAQVFINLLVNAAQALPEAEQASNEIRIVTRTDEMGRAVVEVVDNGCGIPPGTMDRIFEPFFTTKPVNVGTGLGLSICHNVVTALGGEIGVTSEMGRGATFRVVLPAARRAALPYEEASRTVPPPAIVCARVLVIDDEPALGQVLRRVLREQEVTVTTSAGQALELLGTGQRYEVILCDLMMPQMSGMDFHAELSRRFPSELAKVVFLTGGAFTEGAREFLERVPNERVFKPFDPTKVRDLVLRFASNSVP